MVRRDGVWLGFAAVLFALLAVSAPALASSRPENKGPAFTKLGAISDVAASNHQVAMDPSGSAIFVWQRTDSTTLCGANPCEVIEARVRSAGGTLGPVETISDPTKSSIEPDVAVDEHGNAVFTWRNPDLSLDRIYARTRTAAGVLGPIEAISQVGFLPMRPQVAVDEDGNAVFVWEEFDVVGPCTAFGCVRVRARARSAAGVLSPQQDLSDPGKNAFLPQLGVDEHGNAIFVWIYDDPTPSCAACTLVQARARSASGVLSPVQNLSDPGYSSPGQVAVNQDGNAVFSWERFDGTTQCGGAECFRVQTRARSAKGSLSKVQTISDPKQDAIASQVGIDSKGNAVFAWDRGDGSTDCSGGTGCFRVQTRARSASGSLSKVQDLSESGRDSFVPQVAVDARGNAVFVWERIDENFDCGFGSCSQVQARSRSSEGTLSKIQTLSDLGADSNPVVAADPDGGRDKKSADAAADWLGPATQIEAAVQKGAS